MTSGSRRAEIRRGGQVSETTSGTRRLFQSNAQVAFENIRKRLKTFENIRKYSKNDAKRLKIFENIRIFCGRLRK